MSFTDCDTNSRWTMGANVTHARQVPWNLFLSSKQMAYPRVSACFPCCAFRVSAYLNRGQKKCININLHKLIFIRLRRRPRPLMLHFAEELQRLCCECDPAYLTNIARHRCLPRMCARVCLGLWLNHWKYDMWVLLMFFSPRGSVNRFIQ